MEPWSGLELWKRLQELASERSVDAALVEHFEYVGEHEGALQLRILTSSSKGGNWVAGRVQRIETMLEQVAGRKLSILVEEPREESPRVETAEKDQKIRENPVVRGALEIFDATIHSVRDRPDSTNTEDGVADDV